MVGWRALALAAGVSVVAGCGRAPPPPAPPPRVTVYTVRPRPATVADEYVGQVVATSEVTLLAHVTGYLQRQVFRDGDRVHQGDLLFVIDPRPFQAALDQARGQLLAARAALAKARLDVARFAPLVKDRALPRQNLDDARAAERQASASAEAQRAAVEAAQLNLDYTQVRSPVDGRIGRAQAFPGALVSAGQTVMATVSTIDPAQVNFAVSEREYLELAPRLADGGLGMPVQLTLGDGSVYPQPGRIDFVDRGISSQTGTLGLRARFENPEELLRPGMFARVRLVRDLPRALLVPSVSVVQVLSSTSVMVVDAGGKVQPRQVTLGPALGAFRVAESGLAAGDRVVVEGLPQARPGALVQAVAADERQLQAPQQVAGAGTPPPASQRPAPSRGASSAAQGTGQGPAGSAGGGGR